MFSLKQAALLFLILVKIQNVFEVSAAHMETHQNVLVFRGDPVTFTCNLSTLNATALIKWTSGRYHFAYSSSQNRTSNFSSKRVKIDSIIPSKLHIFRAQHDDAGLYKCEIADGGGFHQTTWNLTVSEQEGIRFSKYIFFIVSPAVGLLLSCIMSAVCLCRNYRRRRESHGLVQDCDSIFTPHNVPPDQPASPNCWRSKEERKEYMERLNSIYGLL